MNQSLYPVNWSAIAYAVKDACGWCCMACGKQCRRPGEPFDSHARTLAVAHITQDYEAPEVQVMALCMACHLKHDAPFSWWARRRRDRLRRRAAGQLLLALNAS